MISNLFHWNHHQNYSLMFLSVEGVLRKIQNRYKNLMFCRSMAHICFCFIVTTSAFWPIKYFMSIFSLLNLMYMYPPLGHFYSIIYIEDLRVFMLGIHHGDRRHCYLNVFGWLGKL